MRLWISDWRTKVGVERVASPLLVVPSVGIPLTLVPALVRCVLTFLLPPMNFLDRGKRTLHEFLIGCSQSCNLLSGGFQIVREPLNALIPQLLVCIFGCMLCSIAFVDGPRGGQVLLD